MKEDDESEYGGVLVEESAEEGFVGEAELLTMAELEEEDDDDAGDSLGAMGDSEHEGEELEELGTEDADDVEAVEEDEEGEASGAHDGAAEPEADERPREDGANVLGQVGREAAAL